VPSFPVFKLRDLSMKPTRGIQGKVFWMQFNGAIHLKVDLASEVLGGITEADLEVKVSQTELCVRCMNQNREVNKVLEGLNGKFKKNVDPKGCWYALERNMSQPLEQRATILVIALAKKFPGMPWPGQDPIFQKDVFQRKAFHWNPAQREKDFENNCWLELQPGRPSDIKDPFTTSRGCLCKEFELGQTDEFIHFRVILSRNKFDEASQRTPVYKMFGVDCSEKYFKLFIRGDESSPMLLGRLGGRVVPDNTLMELSMFTREVEGHRVAGTMETLPCLKITLVKADDSLGEWGELLSSDTDMVNQLQGSLKAFQRAEVRR